MPDSDPTYARVAKVANRLLKANVDVQQIHGKEWTISVIQNDERNAFVLPVSKINEVLFSFVLQWYNLKPLESIFRAFNFKR